MTGHGIDLNRRRAGVCLHLTSLPGSHGIGDLGRQARDFLDWMQVSGLSVWQFLPTGPTGYGHSPYQPLSVFAGNPLLIDLDALVDWDLLRAEEAAVATLVNDGVVDFERTAGRKEPLLALAAERFLGAADSGLLGEFETFCAASDAIWLDGFAAFALLRRRNGDKAWPEWPAGDRSQAAASGAAQANRHGMEWRRVKVIQFFFFRQWRSLRDEAGRRGIALFGDVPIYMALDCAEAWMHPELLDLDAAGQPVAVAGVPPDYFSADGQRWGNPLYRWDAHAANGYRWWISRLRHALNEADLVMLDHFRAFDEYWSVPADAPNARDGHWLTGPGSALFDALRAALGEVPFVAEDLGMITESVTALRRRYALPGMQVLQFLVDRSDFSARAIEEDCICYTGTHDNDTVVGWYGGSAGRLAGSALDALRSTVRRNLEGSEQSISKAMISLCFSTAARMAIAPVQDYLGLGHGARLNTPGTATGNWRWRLRDGQLATADGDFIRRRVTETGRL